MTPVQQLFDSLTPSFEGLQIDVLTVITALIFIAVMIYGYTVLWEIFSVRFDSEKTIRPEDKDVINRRSKL